MATSHTVLSRQSPVPALVALVYLVLLVVPWALTCNVAKNPESLVRTTEKEYYLGQDFYDVWRFKLDYSTLTSIRILNAAQATLCFPVLSALLARAAVVFSQRRKPGQRGHLTVRQLFALADRGWCNLFLVLQTSAISTLLIIGWLLLTVAFVLPLARSALVTHDALTLELDAHQYFVNQREIGASPAPGLLMSVEGTDVVDYTRSKLQLTTGGFESQLWPNCNDGNTTRYWERTCGFNYDPYTSNQSTLSSFWESATRDGYSTNGSALMFATSLQAGSTVGYAPNSYALGLQSGAKCVASTPDDVSSACTQAAGDARGWNTSIFIPEEIRVDICLPNPNTGSFWSTVDYSSPWKPYKPVEDLYIGIQEQTNADGDIYDLWGASGTDDDYRVGDELGTGTTLWVHCQVNTVLSYFQLGNDSSKGVPGPFLDELPSDFDVPSGQIEDSSIGLGPLMATAQALFGNNSWLATISSIVSVIPDNTTELDVFKLLCQSTPLGQATYFSQSTTIGSFCNYETLPNRVAGNSANYNLATLIRRFFYTFDIPRLGRAALNTGAFFANNDLLSLALRDERLANMSNHLDRYDAYETPPVIPVVSTTALVFITLLVAVQGLAVLALLAYIYAARVWTHELDALALAGLGAQIAERGDDVLFHYAASGTTTTTTATWAGVPPLRPSEVDAAGREKLFRMDGLIDVTGVSNSAHLAGGGSGDDRREVALKYLPPPYVATPDASGAGRSSPEGAEHAGEEGREHNE